MYEFCTYFDRNYLYKGLTMCRSVIKHLPDSRLWILCFDDTTYDIMAKLELPNVKLIHYSDFEDDDLLKAKSNRSLVEYYWTCTPALPLYLLNKFPEMECITYLDADLFFFDNPSVAFQEFGDASIFLTEHNYSRNPERNILRNGRFNVQFLIFRNNVTGRGALEWWQQRCLEWCYIRREDGKLGDQKYLDDWTERFRDVRVSNNKGIGCAPWNINKYVITNRNDKLYVDEDILLFYHFQNFIILKPGRYRLTHEKLPDVAKHLIYSVYIDEIEVSMNLVKKINSSFNYIYTNLKKNRVRDLASSLIIYFRNNNVVRRKLHAT